MIKIAKKLSNNEDREMIKDFMKITKINWGKKLK